MSAVTTNAGGAPDEPESKAERLDRERRERADLAVADAEALRAIEPSKRKAYATTQGWPASRIARALEVLKLDPAPSNDVPVDDTAPSTGTKQDRALAILRSLPLHRGPTGVVFVTDARVLPLSSRRFLDAVHAEWCDRYPGETLSPGTIRRALASIVADKRLPTTDREPTRDPAAERIAAANDDDRPTIVLVPNIEQNVNEAIDAIARDPQERTFQRGAELVFVTHASRDEKQRVAVAEGSPVIHSMAIPTVRELAASTARWVRVNAEGEERPVLPPDAVVSAVHARKQWAGIRPLVAVSETPFMRPDGTIVQTPGYDPETGYLLAPNAAFPKVPERPSQDEAAARLAELADLFVDFPFVDDASRMVPISLMLTMVGRPAIIGPTPAHVFDAALKGSGKTLQATVAVETVLGRPPALATFPSGRNGQEELEKMLGAYALSGAPVVFFDNVPIGAHFGGAPIEKCLTSQGKVSLRRLGVSEAPEMPWTALVVASGNNITIADETVRRVIASRMVPDTERPEERTGFKYPELLRHVRKERPRLVVAALTVLRAFARFNGHVHDGPAWGSFEAWSRLIPGAIVYAGGADVMGARVTARGDTDEATATLATILGHLSTFLADHKDGLTANAILDALYPPKGPHSAMAGPDGWEELRRSLESVTGAKPGARPDTAKLGTYFRGHRDRSLDGKKLVVVGTHARANRWGVR